jgi:multiple sugar transport system permease protein
MRRNSTTSFRGTDYFFLSPWLITLLLFWIFPVIASLALSFTDYQLLQGAVRFVGFENFAKLFADPVFTKSILNTLVFTVGTLPFTTILAVVLAVFVAGKLPLKSFFQSAYFFPSMVSLVVVSLIFTTLYARGGYIQLLCQLAHIPYPEQGFLFSESTALGSIMLMDIWMATGYYMLLFIAALQAIPQELYEVAILEGASRWQRFKVITLPHLKPMLLFVIVLNSIKSFQIFVEVFVMTKGGPLNSTMTMVYFVYEVGLHKFNIGYGAAAANILFILIALVSWVEMKLVREKGA